MTAYAIEVLHCSMLFGSMAVSNNRAVCLELLSSTRGNVHAERPSGRRTATTFIARRSEEAAVRFSRISSSPLPLQKGCLCFPLLISICTVLFVLYCTVLFCVVMYILCKHTESHFTKSNSLFVQTYLANET